MKHYSGRILIHTCIYFTVTSFLILLIYQILSKDTTYGLQPVAMVLIFPFSLLFAIANVQFAHANLPRAVRVCIHYALTVGGAFVCLYLPNKSGGSTAAQGFILYLALTVLYAVFMAIFLIVIARVRRVTRDESEYQSVYKKK